ncbi:MAG: 16S rRNA (guanine(966)-N(2))-methyltransferase RsmD [Bryobacterales bacterium]|nr:16S rRNA (guanine(966)-N(2))-methyltransferase RsmD [Bryobacterales bacterium]
MRIIGGEFRSRRLKAVPGDLVRPTPDRLRESLFNILAPIIDGKVFLDAYAGTGAVGIEALSRGAARAIFLEKHRAAAEVLQENLHALGLDRRGQIVRGSVQLMLPRQTADIVFLDPPYPQSSEYDVSLGILGDRMQSGLVVVQHASRQALEERYGGLVRRRVVRQGDNSLSFYEPDAGESAQTQTNTAHDA